MLSNIVFIVIFFGCLLAMVVLLIIQRMQNKKKQELANTTGEDISSEEQSSDTVALPNILFHSAMPSALSYRKVLRSFHMSLHKIRTNYNLNEEDFKNMSTKEIDTLYDLCRKNIFSFQRIRELEKNTEYTCVDNVPSYRYLSYIYLTRDDYKNAIYACATALKLNACDEEGKKYMIDRIIRLADEGDFEIPENVQELIS